MPRPPKYKKRSKENKRVIAEKALEMVRNGETVLKIAQALNIPRSTLRDMLANDQLFAIYKEKQAQVLQAEFSKLALRSIKSARKKIDKAGYRDLTLGAAIAYDKANPPKETNINIGDNRTLNVKFSRWENAPWGKGETRDDSKE
jgi:hypothetical protein